MFVRRLLCLAVVVAGAGVGHAAPASAKVTFEPETKSGFVDAADVRNAFGWSDARLARRAYEIARDRGQGTRLHFGWA